MTADPIERPMGEVIEQAAYIVLARKLLRNPRAWVLCPMQSLALLSAVRHERVSREALWKLTRSLSGATGDKS